MIVIPALSFFDHYGALDLTANDAYAARLAEIGGSIIVGGTTGEGSFLTQAELHQLAEIHRRHNPHDLAVVEWNGIAPDDGTAGEWTHVHPPWPDSDADAFVMRLLDYGSEWMAYFHPRYSPISFLADVVPKLQSVQALPKGAKLSKISVEEIRAIRQAVGPNFVLWHGSDRTIEQSLDAGASAVVSQSAASLAVKHVDTDALQRQIDRFRVDGNDKLEKLKVRAIAEMGKGDSRVRSA